VGNLSYNLKLQEGPEGNEMGPGPVKRSHHSESHISTRIRTNTFYTYFQKSYFCNLLNEIPHWNTRELLFIIKMSSSIPYINICIHTLYTYINIYIHTYVHASKHERTNERKEERRKERKKEKRHTSVTVWLMMTFEFTLITLQEL